MFDVLFREISPAFCRQMSDRNGTEVAAVRGGGAGHDGVDVLFVGLPVLGFFIIIIAILLVFILRRPRTSAIEPSSPSSPRQSSLVESRSAVSAAVLGPFADANQSKIETQIERIDIPPPSPKETVGIGFGPM